jgi:hypothetical protein
LTNRWGTAYVQASHIDYDRVTGEKLVEKCELSYQAYKKNNGSPNTI